MRVTRSILSQKRSAGSIPVGDPIHRSVHASLSAPRFWRVLAFSDLFVATSLSMSLLALVRFHTFLTHTPPDHRLHQPIDTPPPSNPSHSPTPPRPSLSHLPPFQFPSPSAALRFFSIDFITPCNLILPTYHQNMKQSSHPVIVSIHQPKLSMCTTHQSIRSSTATAPSNPHPPSRVPRCAFSHLPTTNCYLSTPHLTTIICTNRPTLPFPLCNTNLPKPDPPTNITNTRQSIMMLCTHRCDMIGGRLVTLLGHLAMNKCGIFRHLS